MSIYKHSYYNLYQNIKSRCYNPKSFGYEYYGGRGIGMCSEWTNKESGFRHFAAYVEKVLGDKPTQGHTLDRIDNSKDYEPGNLRWANRQIQGINRRIHKNNTSGHKGVYFDSTRNKWRSQIVVAGKSIKLGQFFNKEDAITARENAEQKYFVPLGITIWH